MRIDGLEQSVLTPEEATILNPNASNHHPVITHNNLAQASGAAMAVLTAAPDKKYSAWAVQPGGDEAARLYGSSVAGLAAIVRMLWGSDYAHNLSKRTFSASDSDLDFLKRLRFAPLTILSREAIITAAESMPPPHPRGTVPYLGIIAMGKNYPIIASLDAGAATYTVYPLPEPARR